jgi:hypothetical protein
VFRITRFLFAGPLVGCEGNTWEVLVRTSIWIARIGLEATEQQSRTVTGQLQAAFQYFDIN